MRLRECIICERQCEEEIRSDSKSIPAVNSGVICRATGNYGSTEYDPFEGHEFLEFVLCDECLAGKSKIVDRISLKEDETVGVREPFFNYRDRLIRLSANIRRTNGEQ
jgi:hypothetical protein